MAVAYDTFANSSGASPLTFNITLGSLTNAAVAVAVGLQQNVNVVITSVTVDGVAASLLSGTTANGTGCDAYIYGVALGTASGSKSVVVTYTGSALAVNALAISAGGVDQTTPLNNGTKNDTAGFNDPLSMAVTSATSDLAFDFVQNRASGMSVVVSQTVVYGNDGVSLYASTRATTPAASVSFDWGGTGWEVQSGGNFTAPAAASGWNFFAVME